MEVKQRVQKDSGKIKEGKSEEHPVVQILEELIDITIAKVDAKLREYQDSKTVGERSEVERSPGNRDARTGTFPSMETKGLSKDILENIPRQLRSASKKGGEPPSSGHQERMDELRAKVKKNIEYSRNMARTKQTPQISQSGRGRGSTRTTGMG